MSRFDWLYSSRVDSFGLRVRRFGSRRYGMVANWISADRYTSASLLASIWRLHFAFGPHDGIAEGFGAADIRGRFWPLRHGTAIGLGWGPR